ncbi:hypothetical protein TI04_12850, partial [Achromatium sp. WMS2]
IKRSFDIGKSQHQIVAGGGWGGNAKPNRAHIDGGISTKRGEEEGNMGGGCQIIHTRMGPPPHHGERQRGEGDRGAKQVVKNRELQAPRARRAPREVMKKPKNKGEWRRGFYGETKRGPHPPLAII